MKGSNTLGATWSTVHCVNCSPGDQFGPAIRTDPSRNVVNIAYYTTQNEPTFHQRVQVFLQHVVPGGTSSPDFVSDAHVLTTLLSGLPTAATGNVNVPGFPGGLLGYQSVLVNHHRLGVAARGTGAAHASHAYVHFSFGNLQGVYSGLLAPDLNNHLSRFDY